MNYLLPALLFIVISAYFMYLRDMRHAVILVYLIVANRAEPYRQIELDVYTETFWKTAHLCWLFERYESDLTPLFAFCCWEIAVLGTTFYLGRVPENDFTLFGLLTMFLDFVLWVWRIPRVLVW